MTTTEQQAEQLQAATNLLIDWCIDQPGQFVAGQRARVLDVLNHLRGVVQGWPRDERLELAEIEAAEDDDHGN